MRTKEKAQKLKCSLRNKASEWFWPISAPRVSNEMRLDGLKIWTEFQMRIKEKAQKVEVVPVLEIKPVSGSDQY